MEQTAEALSIGLTTLYALRKSGALPTRLIGRRRLVAASDLERFIASLPIEVSDE